jgi:hypothetical protein
MTKKQKNEILALRLKHTIFAFIAIPIIFSLLLNAYALLSNNNLFHLLDNYFIDDSYLVRENSKDAFYSFLHFMKYIFHLWFKLIMTSQSLLIGLIGVEIVIFQSSKDKLLNKQMLILQKYQHKTNKSKSKLGKNLFKWLGQFVVFWRMYLGIITVYIFILFSEVYK